MIFIFFLKKMTTQPNQRYEFHPQQKDAGDRILHHFTSGEGEVYGILLAQMQSGKSGAYLYAALKAIHHSEYRIERVFIISGNRDTSLRFQTQQNLESSIERYSEDNELSYSEGKRLENNITVHFGQDLARCPAIPENSMIIVDESHYAQSKDNVPYVIFWQRNGIEKCLSGNMSVLIEKNIRVLSVSATPFSEIIQNQKVHLGIESTVDLCLKNLIYMEPGEGYYGIKQYMDDSKFFFYPREMCWSEWLTGRTIEPKYYIVRTQCMKESKPDVEDKCRRMGLNYEAIEGGSGTKAFKLFEKAPEDGRPTVVHLCGKGRMGQEIDRTHVAMVWESSKNPKADTILQALPGRMCGYGDNTNLEICVPETCRRKIEEYHSAITTGEFQEKLSTMGPAMNVSKSRDDEHTHTCGNYVKDASDGIWKKRVPIRFRCREHIKRIDNDKIEDYLRGIIDDSVLQEILDKKVIFRNLKSKSYDGRHLETALNEAYTENKQYTDNLSNAVANYRTEEVRRFQVLSKPRGEYSYIIGYDLCDRNEMDLERFQKMQHISKVHKKCVFNPAEFTTQSGTTVIANGGQLITFPQETEKDPSLFQRKLEEAIRRTIPTDPMYIEDACPRITSNYCGRSGDWKGVRLDFEEVKIKMIKEEIEVRLRVKINMKKMGGRVPKGYNGIRYSEISWQGR